MRPAHIEALPDRYRDTRTGQEWVRVTTALEPAAKLWRVPPAILAAAADRGTQVHRAMELLHGGGDGSGLDMASLPEELRPYVLAGQRFMAAARMKILATEHWMAHPVLALAGATDVIAEMEWRDKRTVTTIIDYKTGIRARWHALQLAAYEELWRRTTGEKGPIRRLSVYLTPTGYPKLQPWTRPGDLRTYLAYLETYVWEHEKEEA